MRFPLLLLLPYFNPRPREKGDVLTAQGAVIVTHFNPRPREKGDINKCEREDVDGYFNPRPREKGDAHRDFIREILYLFQSTPS